MTTTSLRQDANIDLVLKEMGKGVFHPCYLLWGEEDFQIKEALKKIIDLAVSPEDRDFLVFYLDGDQDDTGRILAAVRTSPLVPGRKIVVSRGSGLFQSQDTLSSTIDRIREILPTNPAKAADDFAGAIHRAGYLLEDLAGAGWTRIGEAEGLKMMSSEAWQDRASWLPAILAICEARRPPPSGSADQSQKLIDALQQGFPADTHLIFIASAVDKRKKLYKKIDETGRIVSFPKATRQSQQLKTLMDMGKEILSPHGKDMTGRAWELLGQRTAFDLHTARSALEKLVNYAKGVTITEQDIEEAAGDFHEPALFDLMTATWEKNLSLALTIFRRLLHQMNHLQIHAFYAREVRLMLQAKYLQESLAGKYSPRMDYPRFQTETYPAIKATAGQYGKAPGLLAGQHPYVIYNCLKTSGRFGKRELLAMLDKIATIDLALKTSGRDPDLLIESFIIETATANDRYSVTT